MAPTSAPASCGAGRSATVTGGLRRLRSPVRLRLGSRAAALRIADEVWRAGDDRWLGWRSAIASSTAATATSRSPTVRAGRAAHAVVFVPTRSARRLHHVERELTYTGGAVLSAIYQLVLNDSSSFGARSRATGSRCRRPRRRPLVRDRDRDRPSSTARDPLLVTDDSPDVRLDRRREPQRRGAAPGAG
jgi:hypothetical protein